MIRCLIVDDKPLAIDILSDYIGKIPALSLTGSTTNPLEAVEWVMAGKADLVFLDIQMPQLNGVQFMKIVQGKCKIILTTAYAKYALDGFENEAIDYLLKPISFERFYKAVHKAQHYFDAVQMRHPAEEETGSSPVTVPQGASSNKEADYIFIKTEYRRVKINLADILYIEGMQNYVAIITGNEKIISLQNIKKTEEQLSGKQFVRIHKSYIVAVQHIKSVERNRIFIAGTSLPLGDVYRDDFYRVISPDT
ncbi:Sensory transduction protein LytR [compost metagenome]